MTSHTEIPEETIAEAKTVFLKHWDAGALPRDAMYMALLEVLPLLPSLIRKARVEGLREGAKIVEDWLHSPHSEPPSEIIFARADAIERGEG